MLGNATGDLRRGAVFPDRVRRQALTTVLGGVFDQPPDAHSVPWPYLLDVAGAAAACTVGAVLTLRSLAERPDPPHAETELRLRPPTIGEAGLVSRQGGPGNACRGRRRLGISIAPSKTAQPPSG